MPRSLHNTSSETSRNKDASELVVGAIAKSEQVLLGFGARQLGGSQPPDADTVFEIGSITKAFTGILLAQQIENGELELDDRIAELLPDGFTD